MARQINHVLLLIGTLLISVCATEGVSMTDWVNSFTMDLNRNINRMVNQINEQVANVQKQVQETIHNLPRDAQGNLISTSNGSIISIANGTNRIVTIIDGVSRTVTSGRLPNGEPYVRDVVEKREGNMLYHNETTLNPKTGASETIAWKLNLAIPGSKPEIITDTKTNEK